MKNIDRNYFKNIREKYPTAFADFDVFLIRRYESNGGEFKIFEGLGFPFVGFPFELQVGVLMAFIEGYATNGELGQCPAAFLLSDGFNVEGIKLNLTRIFARIENNLL